MRLSDAQWAVLAPLIPPPITRTTRGRPRRSDREVLEGILWVLRTGAQWAALPKGEYPPKTTCHDRFQEWVDRQAFLNILTALAELSEENALLDLREAFIDGTFSAAKKGARMSVPPRKAKAPRS
ncbi:transposase [Deinococcus soli (ex Cha et al. 2016)]|uniref:Transposase n=1 Tax=Deinococcus soli (ex Cha et al. 2016) TaxID=1309411 RepID=A0AAE3XHX0_9DEIO|nr:transposase [Deinococcus soli (ex Cha et al. 2016)]GGB85480.1 transposase [Deinococcus soli (ex Cha et al. 2016)]